MSNLRIRFAVTEDDIDQGEPEAESMCPIALAIRRCFSPDHFISVGEVIRVTTVPDSFFEDGFSYYFDYPLDGEIDRFIRAFDENNSVEPFEMEIELKGI